MANDLSSISVRNRQFVSKVFLICAVLLGGDAAWCAVRHLRMTVRTAEDPYSVAALEARFAAVKPYVAGQKMVGYLASRPTGASEADEVAHSVARYALAPTLLCNNANKPVVVANFDTDHELDEVLKRGEFQLVARVDAGLAVLRRGAQ